MIEYETFAECKNLRTVEFSEGLETVGPQAFRECGVESVVTPKSLKTVCDEAFMRCDSLRKVVLTDAKIQGSDEEHKELTMGKGIFKSSAVESVKLPARLKELPKETFMRCENLRKIELPNEIEFIAEYCFYYSGLKEIQFPRSLSEISIDAFIYCNGLKTICVEDGCEADFRWANMPDNVVIGPLPTAMVGEQRVLDLRDLKQVVIPDGVEKIGNHWFLGCDVEEVTIPASVREIGTDAFCNCKKLAKVTFQLCDECSKTTGCVVRNRLIENGLNLAPQVGTSQLRVVGESAFCKCSGLKKIDLPDCVEEIRPYAFSRSGLESFTAPKALRTIRYGAFRSCRNLKCARLNEGLEVLEDREHAYCEWNGVFSGSAVEDVLLPSTLMVIGAYAFSQCKNLKSVQLPDSLERIESDAFIESALESVTLPR